MHGLAPMCRARDPGPAQLLLDINKSCIKKWLIKLLCLNDFSQQTKQYPRMKVQEVLLTVGHFPLIFMC